MTYAGVAIAGVCLGGPAAGLAATAALPRQAAAASGADGSSFLLGGMLEGGARARGRYAVLLVMMQLMVVVGDAVREALVLLMCLLCWRLWLRVSCECSSRLRTSCATVQRSHVFYSEGRTSI